MCVGYNRVIPITLLYPTHHRYHCAIRPVSSVWHYRSPSTSSTSPGSFWHHWNCFPLDDFSFSWTWTMHHHKWSAIWLEACSLWGPSRICLGADGFFLLLSTYRGHKAHDLECMIYADDTQIYLFQWQWNECRYLSYWEMYCWHKELDGNKQAQIEWQ